MFVSWQHLGVSFPVIGVVVFTVDPFYLCIKLLAVFFASAAQLKS